MMKDLLIRSAPPPFAYDHDEGLTDSLCAASIFHDEALRILVRQRYGQPSLAGTTSFAHAISAGALRILVRQPSLAGATSFAHASAGALRILVRATTPCSCRGSSAVLVSGADGPSVQSPGSMRLQLGDDLIVRLHGHRLGGGHAAVVSPCRCCRSRVAGAGVLRLRPRRRRRHGVGVGSAVSSRLLLSDREQVRDNELSWVSASHRGHLVSSMNTSNSGQSRFFFF
jgi:hypothetical protein